ncbi:acyl-CoA thioesterase [Alkaliphilus sp. MSJ-5]|uniref:Acyl-CoA thioesterase n=1 Tax=Alkaliphilus flagellatus TaxID=2841507 RepID=A0ABS6G077_9FIRM|nr:thioesterase family protein [Alkaliphilus flagellatus]MBU5675028.1 acyl-CoA thioesterase [Alkaliphilus flagellatus]
MKLNETKLVTRYEETDQMGIIYHSNYFVYFEVGRTDFLKNYGMKYKDMEEIGIILPVIEVNCKYKVSAKYADELIIKTTIEKLSPTRITFNYKIVREVDGVLLAEGFTEHAFVSKEGGRPMNLKKIHKEVYLKLEGLM